MATRDEIYLAALLHDIGKFWQRADENYDKSIDISNETKNLIDYIAHKTQSGYPTHQHVIWTYELASRLSKEYDHINDNIVKLAAYHHRPENEDGAIIQLADWWARGMEATYEETENDIIFGTERYKKIPLGNVFSLVYIENQNKKDFSLTGFDLTPLSTNTNDIFPQTFSSQLQNSQKIHKELWNEFYKELFNIPKPKEKSDFRPFANTLFYLLKKYLWKIPADTREPFPVSSLFEHTKITAALSWCLKTYLDENKNNQNIKYTNKRYKFGKGTFPLILVYVGISGIQKFIYNITSKYAAKSLRGRSFFLQAIIQDIAWDILNEIGAYEANIVYSSGGKMFLLLPNTQAIREKLHALETKYLDLLWKKFEGSLFLYMDYLPFAYDQENKSNEDNSSKLWIEGFSEPQYFQTLWDALIKKAEKKKQTRYIHKLLDEKEFNNFFEPFGDGGQKAVCAVTGSELDIEEDSIDENNEKIYVNKEVKLQKKIGESLPEHNLIAYSKTQNPHAIDLITDTKLFIEEELKLNHSRVFFTLKNDSPIFISKNYPSSNSYGFTYFGGTTVPHKTQKHPKTFEDLAGSGNFKKLGFLRMDVDGLGHIFSKGLVYIDKDNSNKKIDRSNFSNYATLSGLLDLFFSGYINTIREKPEFVDDVTIIYSGGDDLFAVGKWNKIIAFAYEVQKEFKRFTGRPDITVSAGIEIVGPKFPAGKAAQMAGNAEHLAKHKDNLYNHKKNAICLFDIPINWDHEFPLVEEWKNNLIEWISNEYITKGLLMQLLIYYEKYAENKAKHMQDKEKYPLDLSWKWHAAYNLARRAANTKDENKRNCIDKIKNLLFTEIQEQRFRFEAFAVALRWAELELRESKN